MSLRLFGLAQDVIQYAKYFIHPFKKLRLRQPYKSLFLRGMDQSKPHHVLPPHADHCRIGTKSEPRTGTPSRSSAIETAELRSPARNARVPSCGSTSQQ